MAPETPSKAQQLIGDVAPKLVQLTDDVLFGDVWERPGLSPRDRSLITVAPRSRRCTGPASCHPTCAWHSRTASLPTNSWKPSPTWPSTPAGPTP